MKDEIYKEPVKNPSKFEFSKEVVNVFDDMISRSVPQYELNQMMTAEMTREFYPENTVIYDLGCSTGKTLKILDRVFGESPFFYRGIDSSKPMIDECHKLAGLCPAHHRAEFILDDILAYPYDNAGVFILNYTLQFINPEKRSGLIRQLFESLKTGGILLLCEKVHEADQELSEHFIRMHHRMKKAYGYSDLEIIQKRDAIENVLIPAETLENSNLLKSAGFGGVALYHKWYNFASYVAIKK